MKHIKKFTSKSDYEKFRYSPDYVEPHLSKSDGETNYTYNDPDYTYLKEKYLTFEIISAGTITWAYSNSGGRTVYYRKNGGNWTSLTSTSTGVSFNVSAGDIVEWKGNNSSYTQNTSSYNHFIGSATFNLSGNILSLVYGDNFSDKDTLSNESVFKYLFRGNTALLSSENLVLLAKSLPSKAYLGLFYNCTNMLRGPKYIGAETINTYSCEYMFYGCSCLISMPRIYAKKVYHYGCMYMFYNCTNLTTVYELPATTLGQQCYAYMFQGCTSLTSIPELPAQELGIACYSHMFTGCTGLTSLLNSSLPATTLTSNCYEYMFYNCTSLEHAPYLAAKELVGGCYSNMFESCSSLRYISAAFLTEPSTNYTQNWVNGVSSTGTFYKNSDAQWNITGVDGIPSGWEVSTFNPDMPLE